MPLSELLQQKLRQNQPILTANVLVKVGSITFVPNITPGNEDGAVTPAVDEGQSFTSVSSGSRKGSRLQTSRS